MSSTRVLGLFAKEPRVGEVKTRLAAESSPAWAAEVAAAFLYDLVERLSGVPARRVLAFAPAESGAYFADVARGRFQVKAQTSGNLGDRLAAFFRDEFAAGAEAVVVLGTDSPTVPPAHVEQAFALLRQADVVLGPATDGGYYLIGAAREPPPIFAGIAWGTAGVLAETVARLRESGRRLALLPPWYDVDTRTDWKMLAGHVAALRHAGTDPGVPNTERLLNR
jgi:rSAM/selenodomain-associated transferase 1